MFFTIDPGNGVPIYEQLVRQVKFAVAEGTLKSGQLIPSSRLLAQQLAINPNTINRAWQRLQSEGVLILIRGRGLAVTDSASSICAEARQSLIEQRLTNVLTEALQSGLDQAEIMQMVSRLFQKLTPNIVTPSSDDVNSTPQLRPGHYLAES
ncbi:MAG: GntR family transcriptional regulator [Planctomycetales bacterium]|nr:GntR family transcriptional regulator [Planctomycetales bacterium]